MTETESMVVRVAKAILYDFMPHEDAWDLVDESDRSRCRGYARAAIEAMKEPTPGMEDAGLDANPRGRTISDADLRMIFNAMFVKALEE